jgi:hypothetical protein
LRRECRDDQESHVITFSWQFHQDRSAITLQMHDKLWKWGSLIEHMAAQT